MNYLSQYKKIKLENLSLFFILIFSGYYITRLPVSPVYLFISIGLFLAIIFIIRKAKIRADNLSKYSLLIIIYFIFSQTLIKSYNISTLLNIILSLLVFIVVHNLAPHITTSKIYRYSKLLVYLSIPLLIFEALYRISNPLRIDEYIEAGREDIVFYAYKFNSIMYQDSNFVSIFILSLLFFWFYLNSKLKNKGYFVTCILLILLLLTISRAAIITSTIFIILYFFKKNIYKFRTIIGISFLLLITILIPYLNELSKFDGSFSSKFLIFKLTKDYFINASFLSIFFGVGLGNTYTNIGIGSHNILSLYLIESGVFGFSLIVLFWLRLLITSRYKVGIVMFPFLIVSLSLTSTAIPYLYAIFAIILELERRSYEKNE